MIGLFSTDRAIFKAPYYKITCKDKVIFNRLGYFESLKITPSLENALSTEQVIRSRWQVIANKKLPPLYLSCFRFLASQAAPPAPSPRYHSVGPLEARAHDNYYELVIDCPPPPFPNVPSEFPDSTSNFRLGSNFYLRPVL
jgi:hypothetical protein